MIHCLLIQPTPSPKFTPSFSPLHGHLAAPSFSPSSRQNTSRYASSLTNTGFFSSGSTRNKARVAESLLLTQLPSFCRQCITNLPPPGELDEQPRAKISGISSAIAIVRGVWASEGGWGCDCGVEAEVDGGGASVGRAEVTPRLDSQKTVTSGVVARILAIQASGSSREKQEPGPTMESNALSMTLYHESIATHTNDNGREAGSEIVVHIPCKREHVAPSRHKLSCRLLGRCW